MSPGTISRHRAAWRPALGIGFAVLGVALAFGRVTLPLGISFGYRSCARNVALLLLVGALLGAPRLGVARSRIGPALLAFLLAAALSIAVTGGAWANFGLLATAVGLFYVARTLSDGPDGALWLFHWLGLLTIAILAREVLHDPAVLGLRAANRLTLVTDNPNTIGFVLALLTPIFLAGTLCADRRVAAWIYAAASALAVVITFSRAAWLALALGTGAFALACGGRRCRAGVGAIIVAATATAVLATGYLSLARTEADAQRLRIIAASLSLFREHWLVGVGFGSRNLEQVFPARYLELHGESLFLFHSHNLFVDILTGTGLIGAIASAHLLLTLLGVARRGMILARDRQGRSEAIAYVISIGVFLVAGSADMPLYHGRLVLVLAIVWGMMESAGMRRSLAGAQKSGIDSAVATEESPYARRRAPAPGLLTTFVRPA